MSLMNITAESLTAELEQEIPEMYVVLAKHSAMGMSRESVADIIGTDVSEIEEIESTDLYKMIRMHIGAHVAASQAVRTHGWDSIEETAITKLAARLEYEKDSDFLLKVAAVANKAQRRGGNQMGVLDPSKAGVTAVTLTQRMVQRLQGSRVVEQTEERELSIQDGSMKRVTFAEVDELLSVKQSIAIPRAKEISTRQITPSLAELEADLEKRL